MRLKWLILIVVTLLLSGCSKSTETIKLDPKNPVTITIWHYYNGAQKIAFDKMIDLFNETEGRKKGIFMEGHNRGGVTQLEESVISSIEKKVGSEEIPNIFASYADTAYMIEKKGYLVNLDNYLTQKEQKEYVDSYIEEGRIGEEGELKIFPLAKSTEIFILNKTDWDKFSKATGTSLETLETKEGLVNTAEKYYEWTDSLTPDIPNDGQAFYGRDALANLFIIGSMQLGTELFHVENQKLTMDIDKEVIRKIWDNYYIPYVKGYFAAYGKFRSDDIKTGKIIALTGSTAASVYFPEYIENNSKRVPIESMVLPVPCFEGGQKYAVQQGAGMVVSKSTPEKEYASVQFLKWFTDVERNLEFSSNSAYLPVKKKANQKELLDRLVQENRISVNDMTYKSLTNGYQIVNNSLLYTNKAFDGGSAARKILDCKLAELAAKDRAAVLKSLDQGMTLKEAAAVYLTDQYFDQWFLEFKRELETAIQ